jgi:predicted PurR-regulated permease PerM
MSSKNVLISENPFLRGLQYIVYGSLILYFGRDVFIPISFALLISFLLYPICAWLEKKGVGKVMAIVLSISFLILLGSLVVTLLVYQLIGFFEEWPAIQLKFGQAITDLQQTIEILGFSRAEQAHLMSKLSDQSSRDFLTLLGSTISASASSIVLLVLIPVYAVLILYYRQYWMKILNRVFPSERSESLREMLSLTINAYYNFIKGMALVYVAVGVLNSIGLLVLGVPHAILFGFIASILTFIPYVGIMVGALLPVAMAWITYDSIWYPVGIVAIFTIVQYLEANVIFPFAVSNRLNVNTLAVLIAIFVGGVLWGMAGMILFVPFVGIAKLIADHNPKWKTVSMMLGVQENE